MGQTILRTSLLIAILGALTLAGWPSTPEAVAFTTRPPEITDASEAAVKKGFDWLMKAQNRDGGYGVDIGAPSELGLTAIAGMAMLSQGSTPLEGDFAKPLRKIRGYIIKEVNSGSLRGIAQLNQTQLQRKIGHQAHTFFACLFLSQIVGLDTQTNDDTVRRALNRAVDEVVKAQQEDGSWGAGSWAPVLGTVMGWESLRGAHHAGFRVRASADKVASKLIQDMKQNLVKDQGWMHNLYKNATGIRVLHSMGMDDDPITKKAYADVLKLVNQTDQAFRQAGGEEYLAFHLITETMLQAGGDKWTTWFPTVRDKIVTVQNADGSWTGHHCITSRTFCTAAAILVLQSPNRYLPVSEQ